MEGELSPAMLGESTVEGSEYDDEFEQPAGGQNPHARTFSSPLGFIPNPTNAKDAVIVSGPIWTPLHSALK
jgi:hypothetical protein